MGRIGRGMDLARASWTVVRSDPPLLVLPALNAVLTALVAVVLFVPAGFWSASEHTAAPYVPAVIVGTYAITLIGTFFGVAFAAVVAGRLDGRGTTIRHGLACARSRIDAIAWWALIATGVGLLLRAIRQIPWAGQLIEGIVTSLLGIVWGALTFFVVPVLALEGRGARESVERSATLLRRRWGEGATGFISITAAAVIAMVAVMFTFAVGGVLLKSAPPAGAALIAVAVIAFFALVLLSTALQQVFRVVLYRFAMGQPLPPSFSERELAEAARQKRAGPLARLLGRA